MMSFRVRPPVLLSAILALMGHSTAQAEFYGLEIQAGRVDVSASKDIEINKKGPAYGAFGYYGDKARGGSWALGLGMQSSEAKGKNIARGVKQDFKVISPYVDARYLYQVTPDLGAGVSVRNQFGKGAKYSPREVNDWAYVFAVGAVLQYKFAQHDGWQPLATFSYYTDANNSDRKVHTMLVGIGVEFDPSGVKTKPAIAEKAEPAPKPLPAPVEVQEAAPPAPVVVTLDAKAVTFDRNKATLTAQSSAKLQRLAQTLVEHDAIWEGLEISGHTDVTGRAESNLALSKARAESVCSHLVKHGVKNQKLTCVGYGSTRLLPNLDQKAPDHRRVELIFSGVGADGSKTLNQSISKALND